MNHVTILLHFFKAIQEKVIKKLITARKSHDTKVFQWCKLPYFFNYHCFYWLLLYKLFLLQMYKVNL